MHSAFFRSYTVPMCGRYRLARKKEILAETFDVNNGDRRSSFLLANDSPAKVKGCVLRAIVAPLPWPARRQSRV